MSEQPVIVEIDLLQELAVNRVLHKPLERLNAGRQTTSPDLWETACGVQGWLYVKGGVLEDGVECLGCSAVNADAFTAVEEAA